jgi:ADP-ribosylglycohydrolase
MTGQIKIWLEISDQGYSLESYRIHIKDIKSITLIMLNKANAINCILGAAIGDAMGVPFEFRHRGTFYCKGMTGFGTWNKPPGTYSDDTAMTLCTIESMVEGYSESLVIEKFIKWYLHGYWSLDNHTFDIGHTTASALNAHRQNKPVNHDINTNGNGSLMRMVPLAFWLKQFDRQERNRLVTELSSITHPHDISVHACLLVTEIAIHLINGHDIKEAITNCRHDIYTYDYLTGLCESDIKSDGFVLHTLQASLWVLVHTDNFKDAILKAVNLGGDTDTTACVVGGLAGMMYDIPEDWLKKLRGRKEITALAKKYQNILQ